MAGGGGLRLAGAIRVAGLLLCAISLTEGFASDGTSSQVIKADATTSAASIGLGTNKSRKQKLHGTSPFSQPGKVVKVPVNETFLKSYGGDYGVYGWDTWRHTRDWFLFTSDIDEEQYWIEGHVIIQPVGGEPVHIKAGDFTVLPAGTPLKFTIISPLWIRYRQTYDEPPVPQSHSPWYRKDEIVKFKANDTFVKDLGGDSWEDWEYGKGHREFMEFTTDVYAYVTKGHGTFYVEGGDAVKYTAGDFIVLPAGMMVVVQVESHTLAKGMDLP